MYIRSMRSSYSIEALRPMVALGSSAEQADDKVEEALT